MADNRKTRGNLLLFLTALIWGAAFVAQKIGVMQTGAFTFAAARFYVSGVALLPFALSGGIGKRAEVPVSPEESKDIKKATLLGGVLCGIFLALATAAQQLGLQYTTAGKAGFITALYIIFVPLARAFTGKKVALPVWISVPVAVAGLYLLCVKEGFSVNTGDAMILLCAFIFMFHILVVDRFSPRANAVRMSCVQFFTAAVLSTILMFILEKPELSAVISCWAPLLYLGVVSGAAGYTLQILGQRDTDPTVASLIMSLESVFAAIAGAIFLGESFTTKELIGCVLVFGATIASQINFSKWKHIEIFKENKNA